MERTKEDEQNLQTRSSDMILMLGRAKKELAFNMEIFDTKGNWRMFNNMLGA